MSGKTTRQTALPILLLRCNGSMGSMCPKQDSDQSNDRFQQAKVLEHGTGSRKGKQNKTRQNKKRKKKKKKRNIKTIWGSWKWNSLCFQKSPVRLMVHRLMHLNAAYLINKAGWIWGQILKSLVLIEATNSCHLQPAKQYLLLFSYYNEKNSEDVLVNPRFTIKKCWWVFCKNFGLARFLEHIYQNMISGISPKHAL